MFGIDPAEYDRADTEIPQDKSAWVDIVIGWGKSVQHSRRAKHMPVSEMRAAAKALGATLPHTPAAAAGGRADQGGYYPNKG